MPNFLYENNRLTFELCRCGVLYVEGKCSGEISTNLQGLKARYGLKLNYYHIKRVV